MKTTFQSLFALTICAVGAGVALWSVSSSDDGLQGFTGIQEIDLGAILIVLSLAIMMLAGMFAKALHSELMDLKGRGKKELKLADIFRSTLASTTFWEAVVVSPVVFIGVYVLLKDAPDLFLAHLVAFENGFFWHAVFESRRASATNPNTGA